MKVCRYCGYEANFVCDGIAPRMGCDMPGRWPGYKRPSELAAEEAARVAADNESPASSDDDRPRTS